MTSFSLERMTFMRSLAIAFTALFILSGFTLDEGLSYEQALEKAATEKKNVLLVFSGSDWCKPCILLRRNVLDSEEFTTYATANLVVLDLDFPYKKSNQLPKDKQAHNERLAEKYNPRGAFPMVLVLDQTGEVKGQVQTSKTITPKQFVDQLKAISQ